MDKCITVIGSGPGGCSAAFEAASRGAQVTLIEKGPLGGTCLNCGCIPTKTVKASAEIFSQVQRASEFGISVGPSRVILAEILRRKRRVVEVLASGLEKSCLKHKIRRICGRGRVRDAHAVVVIGRDGVTETIASDAVIIACGSSPLDLPALPVDNKHVFNSEGALELANLPDHLLIVGGGVIGCEFACIYASFGSKVTIVEGQKRLLPISSVDEELSMVLQREMKKKKIEVELRRTVTAIEHRADCVYAHFGPSSFSAGEMEEDRARNAAAYDAIFITVGRTPNTAGLGLEDAGIQTDRRGYITVNDWLETSLPGVFAIGDVLGPQHVMLAHMAEAEGLVAVDNICGVQRRITYDVVPTAIFTSPEIASVGLTEEQAKAQGIDVQTALFQFRELGKAQAMGELPGLFKLVAEKESGRLLGAHIAGAHATDLIAEAALALKQRISVDAVASTIHAHPTLSEGIYASARRLAYRRGDA